MKEKPIGTRTVKIVDVTRMDRNKKKFVLAGHKDSSRPNEKMIIIKKNRLVRPSREGKTNWNDYCEGWYNLRLRVVDVTRICLLYTSPSPRDLSTSRMPSSA